MHERDVALRQLEDVAQHLVLRLVAREDRVRHERGGAPRGRRQRGRLRLSHELVGREGGRLAWLELELGLGLGVRGESEGEGEGEGEG